MTSLPTTSGATDDGGVIRVVPTSDYDAMKGAGIAAPYPGESVVHLYADSWKEGDTLLWRASDEDEWTELERPAKGESFGVEPGGSIRLIEAVTGMRLEMW